MIYAFVAACAAFLVIVIMLARPAWKRHDEDAAKLTHKPYAKTTSHDEYDGEDWRLKVKTVDVTGKKKEEDGGK
jgi:hypothetical protein